MNRFSNNAGAFHIEPAPSQPQMHAQAGGRRIAGNQATGYSESEAASAAKAETAAAADAFQRPSSRAGTVPCNGTLELDFERE